MTDRYERIREALAMGSTPGPWDGIQPEGSRWIDIYQGGNLRYATPKESKDETMANAKHVAACDPDTIRELLEERDALEAENERLHEQLRLATVDQAIAEAEASDAHAENKRLREALKEIRSRSTMNLAMRSDTFEITARLVDIYQIADAALSNGGKA